MIVCSCNVLTDGEIKACFDGSATAPRTPADVYAAMGCTPRCGRCKPTIRALLQANGKAPCCSTATLFDCTKAHQMDEAGA